MRKLFLLLLCLLFTCFTTFAQTSKFTIEELLKVRRVADPQLSPDGKTVAFTIGDVNFETNRVVNQIYLVSTEGGMPKRLTSGDKSNRSPYEPIQSDYQLTGDEKSNTTPRWSPDGNRLAFTTGGQIWAMNADGSDKKQITKISSGAGNPVWSPDGRLIAFVSDVYPDCADDACNQKKDADVENSKVKAVVAERLLFRHWNEWRDKKRTHLFIIASDGGSGTANELTKGDFDAPSYAASGFVDYSFAPDSKEITFLRNPDKVEAVSTNSDIFTVAVSGGTAKNITAANHGYDVSPLYTADGKYIIYRSQATPAFEADRWRLMRFDRTSGKAAEILAGFDQQVDEFAISADSKTVYFAAGERGRQNVFSVAVSGGKAQKLLNEGFASDIKISADGKTLVFEHSSGINPGEIMKMNANGSGLKQLTDVNSAAMTKFALQPAEDMDWTGAANAKVHGFIFKPANFDEKKKYPLLVLIHGGPQGAWFDSWGYRWNPQVFANAGYVVFQPNPRGSTTYGQKFVDEISGDWGGKVFDDIKNGVAEMVKKPYVDKERIGAAGGSYGGYMVDWILGHNDDPRFKFKALMSHAGVYNLESMAGVTEELWFSNWEFKGQQWNSALYEKWSPHKFAANFNTPTLVIHGEQDFRVPVGEGLQLFTTLQEKGVDSKLIYFPDEGHWILKPQNSQFWYKNALEWFAKYLKP